MSLGNAIKTVRKQRGIKQKTIAPLIGISINALCQIEKGNSFPQLRTLKKIAETLEVPISILMLYAVDEAEIPEPNRKTVKALLNAIKELL